MHEEDFECPHFEEKLFSKDLEKLFERTSKLKTKLPVEDIIFDILTSTENYLENLAIREQRNLHLELYQKFSFVSHLVHQELKTSSKYQTLIQNRQIASIIDFLVAWGASKTNVTAMMALWLSKGTDSVEKIAKAHCVVKKPKGELEGNLKRYKKGYMFLADDLLEFIHSKRAFPNDDIDVYNRFQEMLRILKEKRLGQK